MGPAARFIARGRGYTLFLTDDGAVLSTRGSRSERRNSKSETRNWKLGTGQTKSEKQKTKSGQPGVTDEAGGWEIENPKSKIQNRESRVPNPEVIRFRLAGANPASRVAAEEQLPGRVNYFRGTDPAKWRRNIPTYARVRYQNVYPGIDLVYYGKEGELEFDFEVAPEADPRAIRFAVEGGNSKLETGQSLVISRQLSVAGGNGQRTKDQGHVAQSKIENPKCKMGRHGSVRIDADSDLVLALASGEVRLRKPVVYQLDAKGNRQVIEAWFVLGEADEVRFGLGLYDPARPLIIDPILEYSTYLGGSGLDYAQAIAVDAEGNAYVAGYTNSTDFPLASAAQPVPGSGTCVDATNSFPCVDAFVVKLNAAGTGLVYATYLGGSGEDYGMALAVDPATGEALVTGYTNSADFPSLGAFQPARGGGYDAFVAKLSADGSSFEYSTYLGGSGDDFGQGISVSAGRAVAAAVTASADFPTATGAFQPVFAGAFDAFVSRLSLDGGGLEFSTYLGGSGEDFSAAVVTDSAGSAHVAGWTNSSDFPIAAAFQPAYRGGTCGSSLNPFPCPDAFVAKFNDNGSGLQFSTYIGGTHADFAYGIALDAEGAVYLTGQTTSTDLPVTSNAFQTSGGGTTVDAFVAKFQPSGAKLSYATYLGGLGADSGLAVAVDGSGNAYVAGSTHGSGFPVSNAVQAESAGFFEAFLSKVNSTGTALVFSSCLGGSGNEKAHGVAVDAAGNALVVGGTFSTDFPVTSGAIQSLFGGGSFEGFVAKFSDLGRPVVSPKEVSHVFADQEIGTVSAPFLVDLENRGDAPLALGAFSVTGDYTQTNNCPASLPGGTSCRIEITFAPLDFGPRSGSVTAEHNAEGSPFVVNVVGNGVAAPAPKLSTSTLDFGEQSLGTTSAARTVEISNEGHAELVFTSISASGDFAQSSTCGGPVAVGNRCSVSVTFAPRTPGTHVQTLTLVDNAPGSPHVVMLTGTGQGPMMTLDPASLHFGSQPVGLSTPPSTVMIRNPGNEPLEITNIRTGGDFSQTNACDAVLAPGEQCALSITFTPSAPGERWGSVENLNSSPEDSKTVGLAGLGADFALAVAQKSLTVSPGQSATTTLTITPLHGFVGEVSLACSGAPPRSTRSIELSRATLNGTGEVTATLRIQTTARSFALPRGLGRDAPPFPHGGLCALAWLAVLGMLACFSSLLRRHRAQMGLAGVLGVALLWSGCGGGGAGPLSTAPSSSGTPSGTYTLTIEASFGSITHSETVTLTVR